MKKNKRELRKKMMAGIALFMAFLMVVGVIVPFLM